MAKKDNHMYKHMYKHKKNKNSSNDKNKHHKKHSKYTNNDKEDIIDNSNIDINEIDDFDPEDGDITASDQFNGDIENEFEENIENELEEEIKPKKFKLADKTKERLKRKIVDWMDYDDKIKTLNAKTKKYKDAKKEQENVIIEMITKLGMEDNKIDVHDNNDKFRGRVYRYKSVTKGSLKENIIKNALMEAIRDEKKVDQLVKKIESKRPINERYYLKRTKGNKND